MKNVTITIETINAAFPWTELASLFDKLAARLQPPAVEAAPDHAWNMLDHNGDSVGSVRFDTDLLESLFIELGGGECVTVVTHPTADTARRLHVAVTRLYTENRMGGDEMRDMAQSLQTVLDEIFVESDRG